MTDFLRIGPGCGGTFWNNPNIQISTGNLNVDQPTVISVNVTNTNSEPTRINNVQATVCAANTLHGFNSASILPSLTGSNLNLLEFDNQFPFPNDVVLTPGQSLAIPLPQWKPSSSDIHSFDNVPGAIFDLPQKLTLHVCVFANCVGSFPPVQSGQVTDDGALFNWNQISSNFCSDTHHAQHNTTLHRLANQLGLTVPFYAGVFGEDRLASINLQVVEIRDAGALDEDLLAAIGRAGLGNLPIALSTTPAKTAGVAQFRGVAERIRHLVEEAGDEVHEALQHLIGHKSFEDDESDDPAPKPNRQVVVVPGEVHPLLLKAEFANNEPFGSVHIFDITQQDSAGIVGGFRLVSISTPD